MTVLFSNAFQVHSLGISTPHECSSRTADYKLKNDHWKELAKEKLQRMRCGLQASIKVDFIIEDVDMDGWAHERRDNRLKWSDKRRWHKLTKLLPES